MFINKNKTHSLALRLNTNNEIKKVLFVDETVLICKNNWQD